MTNSAGEPGRLPRRVTIELGLVQKGHSRQKQCTHRPGVQETRLVGDVGDAVYRRELVSSQRLLKPLCIRGLGCQHGELHPTQSAARRRCYSQAPSHHLSPTSHQSLSPVLICLLNTSPCCPSSSPPTDPPAPGPGPQLLHGIVPQPLWAASYPWPPCGSQGGPLEASVLAFDSLVEVPLMPP